MAQIILTAVGSYLGGPIGAAIGNFVGSKIDDAIMPSQKLERGKLKEFPVTTSSYGTPLARHFGAVRAGGSVIWATDLKEASETSGGKGKPKVTTYSYRISFAVALSSGPIKDVGRIWADGNLLRGADGVLKTGGIMRLYPGEGEQEPDPLIAAHQPGCPAFRGLSYVVFEDLELADFGNRIPSLSFEIFASEGEITLADIIDDYAGDVNSAVAFPGVQGLSYEQGPLSSIINGLGSYYPLASVITESAVVLSPVAPGATNAPILPEALASGDKSEQGGPNGQSSARGSRQKGALLALRYYDKDRDYLPSLQRAAGRPGNGDGGVEELPVTLAAQDARSLISRAEKRGNFRRQTLKRRIAELDTGLDLSSPVQIAGEAGHWSIESWEWNAEGIELELSRIAPNAEAAIKADSGSGLLARDTNYGQTLIRAFELPLENANGLNAAPLYVATSSLGDNWGGAALYKDVDGALVPCGTAGKDPCTMGALAGPLAPSAGLIFEENAAIEVETFNSDMVFTETDILGIASGQNRLLVGSEVLQYARAEQLGPKLWRLTGLLRGRGGTEHLAAEGHNAGASVTLLDSRLTILENAAQFGSASSKIAAIGKGDGEAVYAFPENLGLATRPLSPVHLKIAKRSNGEIALSWTRRSRGEWAWPLGEEVPLNEERERYRIMVGHALSPLASWDVTENSFTLSAADAAKYAGKDVFACQIGRNGTSIAAKFASKLY